MADSNAIFQHSWYISNQFNGIMYGTRLFLIFVVPVLTDDQTLSPGIELVLYFASVWLIFRGKEHDKRNNRFFLWFSTAILVLITIQVAVQGVFGEMMWITNADYPGGDAAYFADNSAVWYETMGSAASILLTLLSDWLLVCCLSDRS